LRRLQQRSDAGAGARGALRTRSGEIRRAGQALHQDRLRRRRGDPALSAVCLRRHAEPDQRLPVLVPPADRLPDFGEGLTEPTGETPAACSRIATWYRLV